MAMKQRGGIVSVITKVENYISEMTSESLDMMSANGNLQGQMDLVRSMKTKFLATQMEIIGAQKDQTRKQQEEKGLAEFMQRCDNLITKIGDIMAEFPPGDTTQPTQSSDLAGFLKEFLEKSQAQHREQMATIIETLTTASIPSSSGVPPIKLPQITLPTFDGKYSDWMSFKDRFQSAVINYPNLTPVQKLNYLKSSVTGDAASSIKHLNVTDNNFEVAWQLLIDRFERKNEIVADHVRLFYKMPRVTPNTPQAIHQVHNIFCETLMALDAMDISQRDPWVIQFTLDNLDAESKVLWGRECNGDVPTVEKFKAFLTQRCIDHNNSPSSSGKLMNNPTRSQPNKSVKKNSTALTVSATSTCRCCNEAGHPLYRCPKFLSLSVDDRFETVKTLKLCRNCLASHMTNTCTFHKCRKCQGRHNVLLHDRFVTNPPSNEASAGSNPPPTPSVPESTPQASSPTVAISSTSGSSDGQPPKVFLATAMVDILSAKREKIPCRMVMDSGAQLCVMTTSLYQRLKLPKLPTNLTVLGVGARRTNLHFRVQATIVSQWTGEAFTFDCYIMPKITGNIPNWDVDESLLNIPHGKVLADPQWHVSRPVDLLLSGDPYYDSWFHETFHLGPGLPRLNETAFGWVTVGEHKAISPRCETSYNLSLVSLNEALLKFWKLEDIPDEMPITDEHKAAELHFATTHTRTPEGRFLVQLPFNEDVPPLGDSRPQAIRQFLALERRFDRNPAMKELYKAVIDDYISKGWLELAPERPVDVSASYYMPHHGVLKDSVSTKLRVVCNAGAKTSTGVSLNDKLLVGPTVQPELTSILLKFRLHPFAMIADISKMYPQLVLHHIHLDFVRMVWRDDKHQPIKDYRMTRLCFGLASSPFLATRALIQLAIEHQESHPLAAAALREAFYVDDCVISTNSITTAQQIQKELVEVLKSAGFVLTKWMSNNELLTPLHSPESSEESVLLQDPITKVLGIPWNAKLDTFHFTSPISLSEIVKSKRDVASSIAKLFDPLGLVGPVIIEAKIFLQELHEVKASWDDPLPEEFLLKWRKFVQSLEGLKRISIPRWISTINNPYRVDLHVFCDASFKAYGSVVYYVSRDREGNTCSRILSSKSRVAPLNKITIPRLELCGALVGAQMMNKIQALVNPDAVHYWTDSSIVLSWLNTPPDSYKVFVANRITKILSLSNASQWRHVPTKDNPADIISRGCTPEQLELSELWWAGPSWLTLDESSWPKLFSPIPKAPSDVECLSVTIQEPAWHTEWIIRFSSLRTVKRVMAYILRFTGRSTSSSATPHQSVRPIYMSELEEALRRLILLDQDHYFPSVKDHIQNGTLSRSKWKTLAQLAPFVDDNGLIRVGGRLQHSSELYAAKHPILLPKSALTRLIMKNEHEKQLHAGPSLLLATVRQMYWPISGRNMARKIIFECVTCAKAKPQLLQQIMGNLPAHRVNLTRAFHACGVDFAGPLMIRASSLRDRASRRQPNVKCYVAIFICMATKALHIELVSSLTTEAFLASFRRFVARRGTPRHMYSDRGRNFEGATNELARLLAEENHQRAILDNTLDSGVIWHFNPPSAPHHGGAWEAAVKSTKHHLKRITMSSALTYEELSTVLCQIEGVLNSRPLCKMSEDPNDGEYLTPGHFLTGGPLNSLPDPRMTTIPEHRLSMWQQCQARTQVFAEKWRTEYLNTLQQRSKWRDPQRNLKTGEVVLLLDENQRDGSKWILGRVQETQPGADGFVRVVYVRTAKGTYKRPITKIARLPIPPQDEDILDPRNQEIPQPSPGSVLDMSVETPNRIG
ncbi:uncharacterized protein LOC129789234 [Lutzomyia longipalpis]|uniref:uncharacterized protein LOC129789234 n=1 Tax=Lutzomyia longipalpis TaxID=7200 RepID=UPI0024834493|nr:uncharacterized protein LOC129789234 [Lutzomyia longipalpis]